MAFLDFLKDRAKVLKLVWIGFIASLVFMGIGFVLMLREVFG